MKTTILFFFIVLISNCSFGQFTINSSFNPIPGDVHILKYIDTTNLSPGNPGPNQSWNFANRAYLNDSLVAHYMSPSSTPYGGLYSQSTVASYNPASSTFTYYTTSNTSYNLIGYANTTGYNIYYQPEELRIYPLTYNQFFTVNYSGIGIFSTTTLHRSGTEITFCDAYGTITLPSGTSNVMRIRTANVQYDSLFYSGVLHSVTINHDTTWRWLKSNYKFAIFVLEHSWSNTGYSKRASLVENSSTIGINQISSEIPSEFLLSQNYPNPFNPTTNIRYALKENIFVLLKIYDMLGREVSTLVNQKQSPGIYEINFNADNYSSGVYFYKLQAGNYSAIKKMTLLK